jgi:hypothetical protein
MPEHFDPKRWWDRFGEPYLGWTLLSSAVAVASGIAGVQWVTPYEPWGKVVAGLFGCTASLAGLGWFFTIRSHWWRLREQQRQEELQQLGQTQPWWERYYQIRR